MCKKATRKVRIQQNKVLVAGQLLGSSLRLMFSNRVSEHLMLPDTTTFYLIPYYTYGTQICVTVSDGPNPGTIRRWKHRGQDFIIMPRHPKAAPQFCDIYQRWSTEHYFHKSIPSSQNKIKSLNRGFIKSRHLGLPLTNVLAEYFQSKNISSVYYTWGRSCILGEPK